MKRKLSENWVRTPPATPVCTLLCPAAYESTPRLVGAQEVTAECVRHTWRDKPLRRGRGGRMAGRKLVTLRRERSRPKVFRGGVGCHRFLCVPLHPPSASENVSVGGKWPRTCPPQLPRSPEARHRREFRPADPLPPTSRCCDARRIILGRGKVPPLRPSSLPVPCSPALLT